jgi:hypothetical protein
VSTRFAAAAIAADRLVEFELEVLSSIHFPVAAVSAPLSEDVVT